MEIEQQGTDRITAKYKNCTIDISYRDMEDIDTIKTFVPMPFDLDTNTKIISIVLFKCDKTDISLKGNGRVLLQMILDHIKRLFPQNIVVSLTAVSLDYEQSKNSEVQQAEDMKLIKYYEKLGFIQISEELPGIMIGKIDNIILKCKTYSAGRLSRKQNLKKKSLNVRKRRSIKSSLNIR
jgi:hypothetical protein